MTESAAAPVAAPAAVPAADIFTLEVFTPWIGKEFSILHPNVSADFKLRLTNAYDPSKGASHPKFRKPLTLRFRGRPTRSCWKASTISRRRARACWASTSFRP
ncbi:hypothetical protein [Skermanella pratensis]|uniref:hypothetical protein n=1 Tax=Skermanella pratensis TaxID=2233999 RepID=UPI0013012A26|nr:hypothetical protein [Skermanella pratensis]